MRCQHNHAEAQADSDDDERFVIHQALRPLEEAGDEVHAEYEPEHEEEHQTANAEQELKRGHVRRRHRQRCEQHHHDDARDILDDEDAENNLGKALRTQL